jgi:hypothetical protein
MTKNWKKFTAEQKKFNFFGSQTPTLKREHPALQNIKLLFFLLLWAIFALLDPDSKYGSGSTDLIESGSNPDPNPKITGADIGACWGRRTRWRACWPRHAAQSDLISPLSQSSGRGRWYFTSFPSRIYLLASLQEGVGGTLQAFLLGFIC